MPKRFLGIPYVDDPIWPWAIIITAVVILIAVAVWTYLSLPGRKTHRIGVVLGLRLVAVVLLYMALSGTSCVREDDLHVESVVIVAVDTSASMSAVNDEIAGISRWEYLLRNLEECRPIIRKLGGKDYKIKFEFYRFGEEVGQFDPDNPGKADGKRTDFAQMLKFIYDNYRGRKYIRGLIVLSDGANNVPGDPPARMEARKFRNLSCPIHCFTYGNENTRGDRKDIIVTSINPDPSIVPIKGKLTVRATVDAPGFFLPRMVRAKVFFDDKEVPGGALDVRLTKRTDNEVQLQVEAPAVPGEIKVTVKVHDLDKPGPLDGELSAENNEMSTYVTVTREGVRVLLVDRQDHFPEAINVLRALAEDKRISVDRAWLTGGEGLTPDQKGLFRFDEQPYDVIIIGDVTAARLQAADREALTKIEERVSKKRTGLLMMGGRSAFGNGDWRRTDIDKLLPVRINVDGQNPALVKMKPTAEGLKYVLKIAESPQASEAAWEKVQGKDERSGTFGLMNGATVLGEPRPLAKVLATTEGGQPLLVAQDYGTGRTMAFGGDTTYLWIRPRTGGLEAHSRFWRQAVLWLAHREDTDDLLSIRPDIRRIRVGDPLGFAVELRGKQREDLKDVKYEIVEITPPKGEKQAIDVSPPATPGTGANEQRGVFKPKLPGEHIIYAKATGTDASGKKVEGEASARFLAFEDDAELVEKSANPTFMKDIASASGGDVHNPSELRTFLEHMPEMKTSTPEPRPTPLLDWRTDKGPSPFLIAFILLFVQVLALEWFLRRRWGMV